MGVIFRFLSHNNQTHLRVILITLCATSYNSCFIEGNHSIVFTLRVIPHRNDSAKMADDTGIPPFHQEAVSFILANISRLPDDYMECVKTVDETFMRTFENEIHNINTACQKGSQCSRKLFSAIVYRQRLRKVSILTTSYIIHLLSRLNKDVWKTLISTACMLIEGL